MKKNNRLNTESKALPTVEEIIQLIKSFEREEIFNAGQGSTQSFNCISQYYYPKLAKAIAALYSQQTECVSCDEKKAVHEICGDCLNELIDENKQPQEEVKQKTCSHCDYQKAESYHDKMRCRDCRQMDRFKQTPEENEN